MNFVGDDDENKSGKVLRTRLLLSQAFIDMLLYAYDALLHHRVNYRDLGAYKDTTLLDEAQKLPLSEGQDSFITWMGRVRNDVRAAVTRKGFTKV